jgi:hypothetical protein
MKKVKRIKNEEDVIEAYLDISSEYSKGKVTF